MYDHDTHSVPERIVSVSYPFVRPIVQGETDSPVEFGTKLDISVVDGWTDTSGIQLFRCIFGGGKSAECRGAFRGLGETLSQTDFSGQDLLEP